MSQRTLPPLPPSGALAAPAGAAGADGDLERILTLAFAPMHKLAFGVAVGTALGLLLFVLTLVSVARDPADQARLALLSAFIAGYERSPLGAVIGLLWGGGVGFVGGWFAAFTRNLVVATWLFAFRVRRDFAASREFLDHI